MAYYQAKLAPLYAKTEANSITQLCFEQVLGFSRTDMHTKKQETLSESQLLQLHFVLKQLTTGKPVQYVLGLAHFMGMQLAVNEHVLIPRQETEELVQWIADDYNGRKPTILDIGTGSGCIGIALSKLLQCQVHALDNSDEALDIAKLNNKEQGARVQFNLLNILTEQPPGKYDVLVSNPPYVLGSAKSTLHQNVTEHEPHQALFVPDDDSLVYYRRIAQLALQMLNPGGKLYFEINEQLGSELVSLLAAVGLGNIELKQDLSGKDRMIRCEI